MKTLKQILNKEDCGYEPNTKDEKRFIDKHTVKTYGDDATAKSKTKQTPKRRGDRRKGEDAAVYEAVGVSNAERKKVLSQTSMGTHNISKNKEHTAKVSKAKAASDQHDKAVAHDRASKRKGTGNYKPEPKDSLYHHDPDRAYEIKYNRSNAKSSGEAHQSAKNTSSLSKLASKAKHNAFVKSKLRKEEVQTEAVGVSNADRKAILKHVKSDGDKISVFLSKDKKEYSKKSREAHATDKRLKRSGLGSGYHRSVGKHYSDLANNASKYSSVYKNASKVTRKEEVQTEAVGATMADRKKALADAKNRSKGGARVRARDDQFDANQHAKAANDSHKAAKKADKHYGDFKHLKRAYGKSNNQASSEKNKSASLMRNASKVVHKKD